MVFFKFSGFAKQSSKSETAKIQVRVPTRTSKELLQQIPENLIQKPDMYYRGKEVLFNDEASRIKFFSAMRDAYNGMTDVEKNILIRELFKESHLS